MIRRFIMAKEKIIGTYQIINTVNQKSYVGSSNDITRRWRHHKLLLNTGKHHTLHLQGAWNKYGSDAFQFHIIKIADSAEQALQDEQLLLNALWDNSNDCYNSAKNVVAGMGGKHHTEDAKRKIVAALKGNDYRKGKLHSAEHRAALSAAMKGKPKPTRSTEHRAAMSAAMKGKPAWNKGKKASKEASAVQSAVQKAAWIKRREANAHSSIAASKSSIEQTTSSSIPPSSLPFTLIDPSSLRVSKNEDEVSEIPPSNARIMAS